jgi:ABC-2 type transport system permease protein
VKIVRDTWLVLTRQLVLMLRNPVWLFVGVLQPLYFLVLFGPLLRPVLGEADAFAKFVPGLLVMLAQFGTLFVGFGLLAELRAGVIERMRVTPVSRWALLLGRTGRDIVMLLAQAAMLVAVAIPFGLSVHPVNLLLTFVLLSLVAQLLSAVSYAVALRLRSEDAFAPLLNAASTPILLLSGIFLPMTLAPAWLRHISEWNPFSWAVEAARALFAGHPGDPHVWKALVILGGLAIASAAWAARSFARSVR